MNVEIRGVELQDAEEIYNIRQMKGVMENILSYPEEPK
nr:acetyltransferase [Clostridium amylolyticum]